APSWLIYVNLGGHSACLDCSQSRCAFPDFCAVRRSGGMVSVLLQPRGRLVGARVKPITSVAGRGGSSAAHGVAAAPSNLARKNKNSSRTSKSLCRDRA